MWEETRKRTLRERDKQILWERAGRKCEACGEPIIYIEMQVGHKTAFSKGGSTTLRNSVCLCYKCNKLQGTDSWSKFLKKLGKTPTSSGSKDELKKLTVAQLKELAKMHNIKVRGKKVEGFFEDTIKPPTKAQYISAIAKKISTQEINESITKIPKPVKKAKKKRKKKDSFSIF